MDGNLAVMFKTAPLPSFPPISPKPHKLQNPLLYTNLVPPPPLQVSKHFSSHLASNKKFSIKSPAKMASKSQSDFQDFLPIMAEKLGGDGLIGELCKGFQLLMDKDKGVITFESLKKNSVLLGLQDLTDTDLLSMLKEGDFDGDGALNQMEFCVLMFRLSPELMDQSQFLLEEALHQEFMDFDEFSC